MALPPFHTHRCRRPRGHCGSPAPARRPRSDAGDRRSRRRCGQALWGTMDGVADNGRLPPPNLDVEEAAFGLVEATNGRLELPKPREFAIEFPWAPDHDRGRSFLELPDERIFIIGPDPPQPGHRFRGKSGETRGRAREGQRIGERIRDRRSTMGVPLDIGKDLTVFPDRVIAHVTVRVDEGRPPSQHLGERRVGPLQAPLWLFESAEKDQHRQDCPDVQPSWSGPHVEDQSDHDRQTHGQ